MPRHPLPATDGNGGVGERGGEHRPGTLRQRPRASADECGSHLFSRRQDGPTRIGIRLGVLDGEHGVRSQLRQHLASAASWEDDGLPRFDGARAS